MALRLRRDVKKSSYYVWFLGAKESKGLRGAEHVVPVIRHLEQRERNVEPFKVTLQVSHKGLKIIQNVQKGAKQKPEVVKHFIPHSSITCVYQKEDVVACVLLLFNPVTKCPLHVHAYRCDSLETATLLKQQLNVLVERPENQKKFQEIETRLKPSSTVQPSSVGSDTSTRESESSEERCVVATLYDSVAAELREKLAKHQQPLLLPPRDYDTVHRQKGNLAGIELRRCLNANIVGANARQRRLEGSGASSGIGSDHPPSPDAHGLDNHSTSDEDWNGEPADTVLSKYLEKPITRYLERHKSLDRPDKPVKYFEDDGFEELYRRRQRSPSPTPRARFNDAKEKFRSMEKHLLQEARPHRSMFSLAEVKRRSCVEEGRSAGNRHSYAEPKAGRRQFEALHRTNSVANGGRVGLASVMQMY